MSAARVFLLFTLLAASLAMSGMRGASAQVPDSASDPPADSVYTVGPITVTAARSAVSVARASQHVTLLDEGDVAAVAARSVAELLSARSGLFIRRHGQGLATVSQRGGSPSQTQLLIDGMRLADPQLGQFDLSLLPTHFFESVEILHGPGSALYGTDGMSGIIHLRRRRGENDHVSVQTEAGAYGERLASAGFSFSESGLSGLVTGEYRRTEGDFPFVDRTLLPPRRVRRGNADREGGSLFGTLEGSAGRHRLRGAFLYVQRGQGIPGFVGSAQQGERRTDRHVRLWLEDVLPIGAAVLTLRGFAHRGMLRYQNPALAIDDAGRTITSGLEGEYRSRAGANVDISVGGAVGFGAAEHPSLRASAHEVHSSIFGGGTVDHGRLRIYPALRLDTYHRSGGTHSAVSPRLGINVQASRGLPLFIKLNVGRGFRVPTFNDRYWQPGGDPDLKPERARSLDVGIYVESARLRFAATAFTARYADQIVWTDERGDFWSPKNLSATTTRGVEISARFRPADGVTAGAVYAFTRAVDRSNPADPSYNRQLRYVPHHLLQGHVSTAIGPLLLDVNGRVLGRRYVTSDESEHLRPAVVAEAQLGIRRSVGPFRARLSVVVENMLDTRYAVIQGYPMPPRHARVRLLLETR